MRQTKGFSLIEVIVSGAIVATAAGALFTVTTLSTRLSVVAQDRFAAIELAREGVEISRQLRDSTLIRQSCESECADWRSYLLDLPAGEAGRLESGQVLAKSIVALPTGGFSLNSKQLTASDPCSEYIDRLTLEVSTVAPGDLQSVYCRRLFLEPIPGDLNILNSTIDTTTQTMRVRSQVAWLGNGRNALRSDFSGDLSCHEHGEEWCTEVVMVLSDWRPAL